MTPAAVILTVAVYIAVLFVVAYLSGRKADNAGFFTGNRRTPWYMAALAMIGAAISGVTFISVPGSVAADSFSYMGSRMQNQRMASAAYRTVYLLCEKLNRKRKCFRLYRIA